MNKENPFIFNDRPYYVGTIVSINEAWKHKVGFNSILKFVWYNSDEDAYCFTTLQDNWNIYKLSNEQILMYVESILNDNKMEVKNQDINPQYIDGIVSAWIWYILIMLFAVFLQGVTNVILVWVIATIIFFNWRQNKIKGE